ncbi:MAG: helix-turn-helix domain-containing protein [Bifidobacteriaceae bacterium]|jgi:transposase|nr:helix-turn-helix domain-containing protein [Bifidobacteriaceae bacterium]
MANKCAAALELRSGDRAVLEEMVQSKTARPGLIRRARIILLAADGTANSRIAAQLNSSVNTVKQWRTRYAKSGLAGLADRQRPGRPRRIDRTRVIEETLKAPPENRGINRWSTRALAYHLGISNARVAGIWSEYGLWPVPGGSFRLRTEPPLEVGAVEVIGLYLDRGLRAVALALPGAPSKAHALSDPVGSVPLSESPDGWAGPGVGNQASSWTASDYIDAVGMKLSPAKTPQERAAGQRRSLARRASSDSFQGSGELANFLRRLAASSPSGSLHLIVDRLNDVVREALAGWPSSIPRLSVHAAVTPGTWTGIAEVVSRLDQGTQGRGGELDYVRLLDESAPASRAGGVESDSLSSWVK